MCGVAPSGFESIFHSSKIGGCQGWMSQKSTEPVARIGGEEQSDEARRNVVWLQPENVISAEWRIKM